MARGLSQAMAPTTSANDSAGSHARTARADTAPARACLRATGVATCGVASACIAERGPDDLFFRDLAAVEVGNDAAVLEDVNVVAMREFLGLGGVPEERAATPRLFAEQVVDLDLGADVDAAHRIVHQYDPRIRAQGAGEQRLLLVAAGQRKDVVVHARGAN